ncbi:nucleoside-diphosphate sugar epimerase/dehydratase [Hasllibacter sp. MH4015]|uniref:polysaccharide biosynthesis protein n=1 Tax=Hasllibacter sp. MH4015 TaxID=2854029 RepID=UPI001CD6ECF5|nr:nucleoside-diphosphate sugar epimerase/dehydratase [Hasllibacter sp. MH4015]
MLNDMTRRQKRYMFLLFDWAMVPLALAAAFALRYGDLFPGEQLRASLPLIAVMVGFAPFVVITCRLPWIKLTALDVTAMIRIATASVILGVAAMVASYLLSVSAPRSVPIIFGALFFVLSVIGRNVGAVVIGGLLDRNHGVPVAIYGAGAAGIQLASALRASSEVRPVIFIDDNPSLHGLLISGLSVASPESLRRLVEEGQITRILVAMPSLSKGQLDRLVEDLSAFGVEVQVLPSYVDLISGKSNELKTVAPDALLGRDKVDLDVPDIAKAYAGRVVMITGAGGSIGSELCRQLLDCGPSRIVFYEQSEYALYEIDRELRPRAEEARIAVSARLGSVTNPARVASVMADEGVDIVLHAAAYKHVPLVEDNELEGARNNVIGTQIVAAAAEAAGVERFILVSTDKAVRPTNIMGATKRMAEMVVQDMASRATRTRFAMVRFGNVLGSSGSVLPLFQRQIRVGGPVTVTHPDVTRFFMTIPEAARLVLLGGAYATGGDVFVLDMGKPMRIYDIAERMIQMSGAKVRDADHPQGIEIKITGLRPGEKLYEELLIDDDSLIATPHPKILRAEEDRLSQIEVAGMVREAKAAIEQGDAERFRVTVEGFVKGYSRPPHTDKSA